MKYNLQVLMKKYFLHLDQSPRERLFVVKSSPIYRLCLLLKENVDPIREEDSRDI